MKVRLLVCLIAAAACAMPAGAEQVRFHYVPVNAGGALAQTPAGPAGAIGERRSGLGYVPEPYYQTFPPNQMVTIVHPYHGRTVSVPLRLPQSSPRIEHRSDRVVFNYGSYATEVRFFPDGSVDVVYNSGFLRPLVVE